MAEPICSNCKYYRIVSKTPPVKGECHYNPPSSDSIFKQGMHVNARVSVWPIVRGADFCAMFQEGTAPEFVKEVKPVAAPEIQ